MIYHDPKPNPFVVIGFGLAVVFGLLFVMYKPVDECKNYVEMREKHDETQGEYGWPEYREGMDKECGYES